MTAEQDEPIVCLDCGKSFGEGDYKCPDCGWPLNQKKGPKCSDCGESLRVVSRTIAHEHTFQYGQAGPYDSRVRKQVITYRCDNGHTHREEKGREALR